MRACLFSSFTLARDSLSFTSNRLLGVLQLEHKLFCPILVLSGLMNISSSYLSDRLNATLGLITNLPYQLATLLEVSKTLQHEHNEIRLGSKSEKEAARTGLYFKQMTHPLFLEALYIKRLGADSG